MGYEEVEVDEGAAVEVFSGEAGVDEVAVESGPDFRVGSRPKLCSRAATPA